MNDGPRSTSTRKMRSELAWLLYGWSLPTGQEIPDALDNDEFRLWETKARGILSLLADEVSTAGFKDAADLLNGTRRDAPGLISPE